MNLLNDQWIKKGLLKCESRYSNVLCFETNDPKRYDQLIYHIGGESVYEELYLYDKWNGLRQLNRGDDKKGDVGIKFTGVHRGIGSKFSLDEKNSGESNVIDIREACL